MKKILDVLKENWIYPAIIVASVAIVAGLVYYGLFYSPKHQVEKFVDQVESDFNQGKEDLKKINGYVSQWETVAQSNIEKTSSDLKKIKDNYTNLKNKLDKIKTRAEYEEAQKTLKQFAEKGISLTDNLDTILNYFKKVENVVKAFNNLNTSTQNLDEMNALIANFKSISEQSLVELEKIEAPKVLINIDKDYKDLLRQYMKSVDDLADAINKKDTKRIDAVGKESDAAVQVITNQLNEDMKVFSQNSSFSEDLAKMEQFKKLIDENLGELKSKYKI